MRFRVMTIAGLASAVALAVSAGALGQTAPTLDHFTCYRAAQTSSTAVPKPFQQKPAAVLLRDQVDTLLKTGGRYAALGALFQHCNPTQKTVPSGQVTPITNPDAHLDCWKITVNPPPAGTPTPNLQATVTNQFGTVVLQVKTVQSLCVPSRKNLQTPPDPGTPPNLDHFDCYAVGVLDASKLHVPSPIDLQDQFGTRRITSARPTSLCMPVRKQVYASTAPPALINPAGHLLCFTFTAQSFSLSPVYIGNQFGVGALSVGAAQSLCVPSSKRLVNVPTGNRRAHRRAHHRARLRHRRS